MTPAFIWTALACSIAHPLLLRWLPAAPLFAYRQAMTLITFAVASILVFPLAVILTLSNRRRVINYAMGRMYRALNIALVGGVRCRVEDPARVMQRFKAGEFGPCVFVSNHQNMLDFRAMSEVFPSGCVVMAKKSFAYYPFMGWAMFLAQDLLVDRSNPEAARRTLDAGVAQLNNNKTSLWVFPEGTRARQGGHLLPFKKGGFHLAQQTGFSVIPVVFSSFASVYDSRKWRFPGGVVVVRIMDPVPMQGVTAAEVGAVSEQVREGMQKVLDEISTPESLSIGTLGRSKSE